MQRFLLLFFLTASLFAQSTLTVRVNEHYTRQPIAGVQVRLEQSGSTTTATTDSTGTAQLSFTATGIELAPVVGERPQKIELYNILGQRILSLHSVQDLNRRLGTLASGVYILRAFYRQQVVQAKSVVLNGHALNANWNGILNRRSASSPNRSPNQAQGTVAAHAVAEPVEATAGDLHLTLSKDGCTSFDTTFTAPTQDTTLQVLLHQINRVKIRSFNAQGHELRLPFTVRGLSYSLETTGDSLELYSGRYRLQAQNPDTLQALIDTVEIVSDSTLTYVLPAVQKYRIILTFRDTDSSPITNLNVELWKDNNLRYAFVTDSSGLVQDSVYSALYILKTHKDNVKPLATELNVNANLEQEYVTDEKDRLTVHVLYADSSDIPNAQVTVDGTSETTDSLGMAYFWLYDGSYALEINGDGLEEYKTGFEMKGETTKEATVREVITIPDYSSASKEDSSFVVDLNSIEFGTSKDTSYVVASLGDVAYLGNSRFKITPPKGFNGILPFTVHAIAAHGTEKTDDDEQTIEAITDLKIRVENYITHQPDGIGFVEIDGKRYSSGSSEINVQLPDNNDRDITVWMEKYKTVYGKDSLIVWSYGRVLELRNLTGADIDTLVRVVTYDGADVNGNTTGHLFIDGMADNDSTAMTPEHWREFIFDVHGSSYLALIDKYGDIGPGDTLLTRWSKSSNGFIHDTVEIVLKSYDTTNDDSLYMEDVTKNRIYDVLNNYYRKIFNLRGLDFTIVEIPYRVLEAAKPRDRNKIIIFPRGNMINGGSFTDYGEYPRCYISEIIKLRSGPPYGDPGDTDGYKAAFQEIGEWGRGKSPFYTANRYQSIQYDGTALTYPHKVNDTKWEYVVLERNFLYHVKLSHLLKLIK